MAKKSSLAPLKEYFRFPVTGDDWQNRFLVGSVLIFAGFFIPVVPIIFVYGYMLQIMRIVIEGNRPTLPAWEEWGSLFKDGLRVLVVSLVFLLPAIIVMCGATGLYFAGSLPLMNIDGDETFARSVVTFYLLTFGVLFFGYFVGMILLALGLFPLPFAIAHIASENSASAAFSVRQWWPGLRKSALEYLIAWLLLLGLGGVLYLGAILGYYSIILCCFLPFLIAPAAFYITSIWGGLFGEVYREGMRAK